MSPADTVTTIFADAAHIGARQREARQGRPTAPAATDRRRRREPLHQPTSPAASSGWCGIRLIEGLISTDLPLQKAVA